MEGDLAVLEKLLNAEKQLVRERSQRDHRCTLLHYSSANGVEPPRQKTPSNAPEVARMLLRYGADPDATAGFGAGGPQTTPLVGLVSSSFASGSGLHAELVDVFIEGGATVDGLEGDSSPLDLALGFGYQDAALAHRRRAAAILSSVSFAMHLVGDLVGGRGPDGFQWPIPLFQPFHGELELSWSGQWELNAWPNFVVTAGLLVVTGYLAWRRGFSPLELVSPRADRAFVATLRNRFGQPAQ